MSNVPAMRSCNGLPQKEHTERGWEIMGPSHAHLQPPMPRGRQGAAGVEARPEMDGESQQVVWGVQWPDAQTP